MESSIDWNTAISNAQSTMLLFLTVALVYVIVCYFALKFLGWLERREYRRRLYRRHDEMVSKTNFSDMHCWLKIQRRLEDEGAPPTMMKVVKQCIAECRQRQAQYLDIYLKTGRKIRINRNSQMEQT